MTPPRRRFGHRTLFTGPAGDGTAWAEVRLWGEVDLEAGAEVDALLDLCLACRPAGIRIDVTAVGLLDCAGLRHLERAAETAARAGVSLVLGGTPQPLVARLLALTGTRLGRPDPGPRTTAPVAARHPGAGRRERLLRLSMLTIAGSTVLGSLLFATLAQTG
ncbi:STAS domain-containing protein [Streptomyces sp. NPDC020875]|uniref:STAS domain-containing protein n=1 Tax=Streptomyces sp. NPDC020875 TaxID=3154898 RepID=UPI0033FE70CD